MKSKLLQWLMLCCYCCVSITGIAGTSRNDTVRIEAESAVFVQGLDYNNSTNEKIRINGDRVERIWHTNYLVYRNVDFGNSTTSIRLYKEIPRGCKVELWIGALPQLSDYNKIQSETGTKIGEVEINPSGYSDTGWGKWFNVDVAFDSTVSGIHDLTIVFLAGGGSATNQQFGGFDWYEVNRSLTDIESMAPEAVFLAEKMNVKPVLNLHPSDAYSDDLTWNIISGSENISLDAGGYITGLQAGSARISVSSSGNPSVNTGIDITVEARTSYEDTLVVEAETASLLYNSYRYDTAIGMGDLNDPDDPDGRGVLNIWHSNYVEYKNIDFGSYTEKILIRKNYPRQSKVELWIDGFKTRIGSVEFTSESSGYNVWNTYEISVLPTSGLHDVQLVFLAAGTTATNQQFGSFNRFSLCREWVIPESISGTDIHIENDRSETIRLSYLPAYAFTDVIYSIESGSDVVSLENGVVTGKKQGTAQIKVTSVADPDISTLINVDVSVPEPEFPLTWEAEDAFETEYAEVSNRSGFSEQKGIGGQDIYGTRMRYNVENVAVAGTYHLKIDYADMSGRTFSLKVNHQKPVILKCDQGSSNWDTADASVETPVYLEEGDNILEIEAYDQGSTHLPAFDKFTLSESDVTLLAPDEEVKIVVEAEDFTSTSNSDIRDYSAFSGGKGVGGENKYNEYTIPVTEAGNYDLLVYYADNSGSRSFYVKINDNESIVYSVPAATQSWGDHQNDPSRPAAYRVRAHISLNEGDNNIRIGHDATCSQYSPNFDKLELVKYGAYTIDDTPGTSLEVAAVTGLTAYGANRSIAIGNTTGKTVGYQVFDIAGKTVAKGELNDTNFNISVEAGLYIVRLASAGGEALIDKVLVK